LKIINVVGARPNFMKMAPIHRLMLDSAPINPLLLHTGQHYDERMSKLFFNDLQIPEPNIYLGVGSGSHAVQTARIMTDFEQVCQQEKPDWVIVVGDVNSTAACSLVAKKLHINVAHVESGLRSNDRRMPEEINRIVTDAISDILFTSEKSGNENLGREGIAPEKIHFVGNVMIDSLLNHIEKAKRSAILEKVSLQKGGYVLVTLHRPSNVDNREILANLVDMFAIVSKDLPVVFPIHPRTRKMLDQFDLADKVAANPGIQLIEPQGYLDFMNLMANSTVVVTDSGGIQEETTCLKIPCITMRENTERPSTVELGTNVIVGTDTDYALKLLRKAIEGDWKDSVIPPKWDGKTAERIVETFERL
jgi:UDP-N-acetylglucosamine 2-epimerase (non-hydrolysing)